MKKIITIAAIAIVSLAGVFAGTSKVTLNAVADKADYVPTLYYVESVNGSDTEVAVGDAKSIYNNDGKAWNLKDDGNTNRFVVRVSGNENKSKALKTTIKAGTFQGLVDNKAYDSTIEPALSEGSVTGGVVKAGYNDAVQIASFSFSWNGIANLPAADYTSDISITYTVE